MSLLPIIITETQRKVIYMKHLWLSKAYLIKCFLLHSKLSKNTTLDSHAKLTNSLYNSSVSFNIT